MSAWPQMGAGGVGAAPGAGSEGQMQVPPPVSNENYSTAVGPETRSNYIRVGLLTSSSYSDNVLVGTGTYPISDVSYTLWPTISFDKTTARMHQLVSYTPGFTLYQHNSDLNYGDQNLAYTFKYRLSPHTTLSLADLLGKTSNALNQPFPLAQGVSGSLQSPPEVVVAATASQLNNNANAELTYQFDRDSMVGASCTFTNLDYLNPNQADGLFNSTSRGGAGFYNHRLSEKTYLGATYQYSQISSTPVSGQGSTTNQIGSDAQTNTLYIFLTLYLAPKLSLSLSAGPQHYEVTQPNVTTISGWMPAVKASVGWQARHAGFAASYSYGVSAGGGLNGAFDTQSAAATGRWQLTRSWTLGATVSYAITKAVSEVVSQSDSGGHSFVGTVAVQHPVGEHLTMELGYTRLQQSYGNIAVIANAPDANREYIAIAYRFARPLGR